MGSWQLDKSWFSSRLSYFTRRPTYLWTVIPQSFEPSPPNFLNHHPPGPSTKGWQTHGVKGATDKGKNMVWRASFKWAWQINVCGPIKGKPKTCTKAHTIGTPDGNYLDTHLITIESLGKWNSSVKRIPEDTHVNEDLLYKESVLSITFGAIQEDS